MTIFLIIFWVLLFATIGALAFIQDSTNEIDFSYLNNLDLSEEDDLP